MNKPPAVSPWMTSDPRVNAQIDAAFAAVWSAFPYFELSEILFPPRGNCMAGLARQCFLHILVNTFRLPKKRLAVWGNAGLPKIKNACRSIDQRRQAGRFASWFDAVAADAARRFSKSEYVHG